MNEFSKSRPGGQIHGGNTITHSWMSFRAKLWVGLSRVFQASRLYQICAYLAFAYSSMWRLYNKSWEVSNWSGAAMCNLICQVPRHTMPSAHTSKKLWWTKLWEFLFPTQRATSLRCLAVLTGVSRVHALDYISSSLMIVLLVCFGKVSHVFFTQTQCSWFGTQLEIILFCDWLNWIKQFRLDCASPVTI